MTREVLAVDTSVAVPLLVQTHREHFAVASWASGRALALSGHAAAETYSVMTRLPGDLRAAPSVVADLVEARFGRSLVLGEETTLALPRVLSDLGVSGGAVYDAMVALAAREHGAALATRDARAANTYRAVGVEVVIAG